MVYDMEIEICLDCGTPMQRALGHPYCPRCEWVDTLVADGL